MLLTGRGFVSVHFVRAQPCTRRVRVRRLAIKPDTRDVTENRNTYLEIEFELIGRRFYRQ